MWKFLVLGILVNILIVSANSIPRKTSSSSPDFICDSTTETATTEGSGDSTNTPESTTNSSDNTTESTTSSQTTKKENENLTTQSSQTTTQSSVTISYNYTTTDWTLECDDDANFGYECDFPTTTTMSETETTEMITETSSDTTTEAGDMTTEMAQMTTESPSDTTTEAGDKTTEMAQTTTELPSDTTTEAGDKITEMAQTTTELPSDTTTGAGDMTTEMAQMTTELPSDTTTETGDMTTEMAQTTTELPSDTTTEAGDMTTGMAQTTTESPSETTTEARDMTTEMAQTTTESSLDTTTETLITSTHISESSTNLPAETTTILNYTTIDWSMECDEDYDSNYICEFPTTTETPQETSEPTISECDENEEMNGSCNFDGMTTTTDEVTTTESEKMMTTVATDETTTAAEEMMTTVVTDETTTATEEMMTTTEESTIATEETTTATEEMMTTVATDETTTASEEMMTTIEESTTATEEITTATEEIMTTTKESTTAKETEDMMTTTEESTTAIEETTTETEEMMTTTEESTTATDEITTATEIATTNRVPTECPEALEQMKRAMFEFSIKFLEVLTKENPQTTLVGSAVAFIYLLGAMKLYAEDKQKLDEELTKVLGVADNNKVRCSLLKINEYKNELPPNVFFYTANNIVVDSQYMLTNSFKDDMTEIIQSPAYNLNFTNADEAVGVINDKMEDQTDGLITNVIPSPNVVNESTQIVFVSGLYYLSPFLYKPSSIEIDDFYVTPCKTVKIAYYRFREVFNYTENVTLGVRALEIPLRGSQTLLLILPITKFELDELITKLRNPDVFYELRNSMKPELVDARLPTINATQTNDVKDILMKTGTVDSLLDPDTSLLKGFVSEDQHVALSYGTQKITFSSIFEGELPASIIPNTPYRKAVLFDLNYGFFWSLTLSGFPSFVGVYANDNAALF